MAIALDETIVIFAFLIGFGGYLGLVILYSTVKKWVPEWSLLAEARKKNLPVLSLTVAGSGETEWILGVKDERGDPIFDIGNQFGIQVDPKFTGELVPDRLSRGLKMYHYSTIHPLAIDGRNCLAIQKVLTTVRIKFPQLDFLTNDQLNALLNTPRDDLPEYSVSFMEMCGPSFMENGIRSSDDLTYMIATAQDELAKTPITSGWVSYAYAFKNIATAYLSQDTHQLQLLTERKVRKQLEALSKKMTLIYAFGLVAIGLIMAGAIAYTIISP